jgi:glycosyltransferase involved in cell wall biosynthesis
VSIVFDVTSVALHRGGIGRYSGELLDRLLRGRWGAELALVSPAWGGPAGSEAPSGWLAPAMVRRLAPTLRYHRLRLLACASLGIPDDAYWGNPRVLHVPDAYAPPLRRGATVVTLHDLTYRLVPRCHTLGYRSFLAVVVPSSLRRADVVIADSIATREDARRLLGVAGERIQIVYPGVSPVFALRDPDECRARVAKHFGLARGFVLIVGTLEPRKNHAFLLECFARLVSAHGYAGDLVVVGGPGWGGVRLESRAESLGIADRLRLLGHVSDEDLAALYGNCDAFVLPSLYEGFGLPVVEALACGAPVIVSDRGALPETAGAVGTVLPLGDPDRWAAAIAAITPEVRRRVREQGPVHAARFSYDAAAREIEALWSGLLEG